MKGSYEKKKNDKNKPYLDWRALDYTVITNLDNILLHASHESL